VAGTDVARELPSKTIVGLEAVDAKAWEPIPETPDKANEIVSAIETELFLKVCMCILAP
jgi:biotin synthase-like enzyme